MEIPVNSHEQKIGDNSVGLRRIYLFFREDHTLLIYAGVDFNDSPMAGTHGGIFEMNAREPGLNTTGYDEFKTKNAERLTDSDIKDIEEALLNVCREFESKIMQIYEAAEALLAKNRDTFEVSDVAEKLAMNPDDIPNGLLSRWWVEQFKNPKNRKKPGLVKAMVSRTADSLVARGKTPNATNVRVELGKGDRTTITKYLNEWKAKTGKSTSKYEKRKEYSEADAFAALDKMLEAGEKINPKRLGEVLVEGGSTHHTKINAFILNWKKAEAFTALNALNKDGQDITPEKLGEYMDQRLKKSFTPAKYTKYMQLLIDAWALEVLQVNW